MRGGCIHYIRKSGLLRMSRLLPLAPLAPLLFAVSLAQAQVNVTTFHNDNARTGQNLQETILTPANVNSTNFGKLFAVALDGYVYAQPLYLSGIRIGSSTHNVVYMATENDSVYAIDADSGTIYARVSLIPAGGSTLSSADLNCGDLVPQIGITGTPVIDSSSGTLYLVSKGKTSGGTIVQYLHALDVSTLAEKFGGPVEITAFAAGTASDGNGSTVTFDTRNQIQRPALLLENGHVVIGWAGHCDAMPWHGWVISYSASTLAQEAVFNTTPDGSGGGVWMSGGGIAADPSGNIYFPTGNGSWNGSTDFGDSVVKLAPPAGGHFAVLDYFTPWNQATLSNNDTDLGSGGIVLMPTASGKTMIAQQGKFGALVLLNSANLGKYCVNEGGCSGGDPNAAQEIESAGGGVWGSPAYWNGHFYIGPAGSGVRGYSFDAGSSGKLSSSPIWQSTQSFVFAAPTPAVSANGTVNGIVWALDGTAYPSTCTGTTCLGLYAWDANNLSTLLYNSSQSSNGSPGTPVKYAVPVIANGKVYVGTQSGLAVYGLLAGSSGGGGSSSGSSSGSGGSSSGGTTLGAAGSVNLSNADNVAGIVNNGSIPTLPGLDGSQYAYSANLLGSSLTWSGATFTFASAGTLNALHSKTVTLPAGHYGALGMLATAAGAGSQPGQTFTVTYTDGSTTSFVQGLSDWLNPQGYAGEAIASTMAYRVGPNGATSPGPVYLYGYSFALNSANITLPNNPYVNVLAIDLQGTATVGTPTAATPTFSPVAATYSSAQMVKLSGSTGAIYYTTDGSTPTTSSSKYSTPVPITSSATIQAISTASGYANSAVGSATYIISNAGSSSSGGGSSGGSSGSGTAVSVSLASAANRYGITNNGTGVADGGMDGSDYGYSASLLGTSISWSGTSFRLGAAATADAVSGSTIALPAGSYASLNLLAAAGGGSQPAQTFVVSYTDGTTSRFVQGVSDWLYPQGYAGETIVSTTAYRIAPNGATSPGPIYVYGYTFALNSAKSVASITLPNNARVVLLAASLIPAGGSSSGGAGPQAASISGVANEYGIVSNGSPVPDGNLDGDGNEYSANLLGASVVWSGTTFTLGAAGTLNAVNSRSITLPAGNYSTLRFLATGVDGAQPAQRFTVNYSDGSTATYTQGLSDWFGGPQGYTGESVVSTMAYRVSITGATSPGPVYLYGYSFALNSAKSVSSISLPANRSVEVLAVTVSP